MRTTKLLVLLLACLILPQGLALAMDYYVDKNHPAASDTNFGTEARPLLTIDRAMAIVKPGDHVYIKGGTNAADPKAIYDRSGKRGLPIVTPGTPGHTITIEAYPGDTVVLHGDGNSYYWAIDLPNASYYTIKGFIFEYFGRCAYSPTGNKTDILIEDCEFSHNSNPGRAVSGFYLDHVNNFTAKNVYIHDSDGAGLAITYGNNIRWENVEASNIGPQDSDGFVANYVTGLVAINCSAHDIVGDGFDMTSTGVMINCIAGNASHVGVKLWRRSGDSYAPKVMTLINNIIYGNVENGIRVSEGAEMRLYNSVLYDNGNGDSGIYYTTPNVVTDPVSSQVVNNIIAQSSQEVSGYYPILVFSPEVNVVDADHNLYYAIQHVPRGLHSNTSVITSDPLFLSPSTAMFQLQSSSPAVDAGVTVPEVNDTYLTYMGKSDAEDYDGVHRPTGTSWDIGAYEYVPQGALLYGDVSGDGKISAYDAALTAQAAVGLITLTPEQTKAADVSGDKEVSAYDAALIAQRAVGLIEKFPVEG